MGVYISLLAAVVLPGIPLCSKKCGKWGRAVYCVLAALILIFVASVRLNVSYDYNYYAQAYTELTFSDISDIMAERYEKGFLLPLYVLNLISENYVLCFVYVAIVVYSAVFVYIYRHSDIPWVSAAAFLCFGLFFNSLCFLRQIIAAVVAAYGMKYAVKGQPYKFAIMMLMAGTFHWSALILVPMYFLLRIKPSYTYLGIMAGLVTVFCIVSRKLMLWAIDVFYMYRGYNVETNVEASMGLTPAYCIMFGLLFAVCFLFRERLIAKREANIVYINCLMFTTIFEIFGAKHAILSRFAILFYITPILYLLPDAVVVIKEYISEKFTYPKRRTAVSVCSAMVAAVYFVGCYCMLMANDYNGVMPYDTFLGKDQSALYSNGSEANFGWSDDDDDIAAKEEELADEQSVTAETEAPAVGTEENVPSEQTEAPLPTEDTAATAAEESITEPDDEEEEWGDWDDESFDEDAFNDALVSQLEALG